MQHFRRRHRQVGFGCLEETRREAKKMCLHDVVLLCLPFLGRY